MSECEYCQGTTPINMADVSIGNEMDILKMYVEKGYISAFYNAYSLDSSFDGKTYINFCPMCGRKLEREITNNNY